MPVDILLFVTWKTRGSWHLINENKAEQLLRLLPGLAQTLDLNILELAVVPTHVHLVLRTQGSFNLPQALQRLKGSSARILNRGGENDARVYWDPGYDARSIGRRDLAVITRYFDQQARKHSEPWVGRYSIEGRDNIRVIHDAS